MKTAMRTIIRWAQSNQGCLVLTGIISLYFLAIYRPLLARTERLDGPLQNAWDQLAEINRKSLTPDRLDLDNISRGLTQLELNLTNVTNANETLLSRIEIDPFYQSKTTETFQLIDYQNQRQSLIESLGEVAHSRNVKIEPAVFEGFPTHLSDQPRPSFLWAELIQTHHLIQSLIYAKIDSIQNLSVRRQRVPILSTAHPPALTPVISEVKFSCNSARLARLLLMLPLHSGEINQRLALDYPPHKPSLYVDQILIQKDSPERTSNVTVWMKTVGFVLPSAQPVKSQEG
ncbi:MAG: hypothetical protein M2R45_04042 [Verrucomicrobia subdivision 3 bacterium]|nr:hypothetical protein [Limisphaerales bacterium]MCS1416974.1 hypothetical protein [Limisphaerales bacterium]